MAKTTLLRTILYLINKIIPNLRQFWFSNSVEWWERRYSSGGTSGEGSYGRLAEFKAEIVNKFVKENGIGSVVEFGCGDGNQLKLSNYPAYIGLDVSSKAVAICNEKFIDDRNKNFFLYDPYSFDDKTKQFKADLALSLDVVYHLVEDDIYITYLKHLFSSGVKYVIVYASDKDEFGKIYERHVRHRKFTTDVAKLFPSWKLIEKIKNKYSEEKGSDQTSFSDFFVFKAS